MMTEIDIGEILSHFPQYVKPIILNEGQVVLFKMPVGLLFAIEAFKAFLVG